MKVGRFLSAVLLLTSLLLAMLPQAGFALDAKLTIPSSNVTASADDGNVAANVVDGNLATRWSASGDGQWIQFKLNADMKVSFIKMAF